jgi:hypothetical protein
MSSMSGGGHVGDVRAKGGGDKSIGALAKVRLRSETRLRDLLSPARVPAPPSKVVFFHVPKCGGTSIKHYLLACLGSKSSGRSAKLSETFGQPAPTDGEVDRVTHARFIHARCSWAALDRLDLDEAFVFTFLREPSSRVRSWHRFASSYPEERYTPNIAEIFRRSKGLSPIEMFSSDDPLVRCMIDNYVVRQFAGRVLDYPIADAEWPAIFETAKARLRSLSFVGFHDAYESDFTALMEALHLPRALSVPHDNATHMRAPDQSGKQETAPAAKDEATTALAPLIEWDNRLYAFARSLKP